MDGLHWGCLLIGFIAGALLGPWLGRMVGLSR